MFPSHDRGRQGNTSGGFGLVQWTPGSMIINHAKSKGKEPGDMNTQLDAIDGDIFKHWIPTSRYKMSYGEFKKSTLQPHQLANAFLLNFERPAAAESQLTYMESKSSDVVEQSVVLIGDSLLAGQNIKTNFPKGMLDAAVSRFMVHSNDPSGKGDGYAALERLKSNGNLKDANLS